MRRREREKGKEGGQIRKEVSKQIGEPLQCNP